MIILQAREIVAQKKERVEKELADMSFERFGRPRTYEVKQQELRLLEQRLWELDQPSAN